VEFRTTDLPLARIKKIMKLDDDVKMISAEVPILFAKAAELFIQELTIHSWLQTEESRRRTLQVLIIKFFSKFNILIF
jgi:nuclear transcription factor Y gamma